jgi:hypothetical protein
MSEGNLIDLDKHRRDRRAPPADNTDDGESFEQRIKREFEKDNEELDAIHRQIRIYPGQHPPKRQQELKACMRFAVRCPGPLGNNHARKSQNRQNPARTFAQTRVQSDTERLYRLSEGQGYPLHSARRTRPAPVQIRWSGSAS